MVLIEAVEASGNDPMFVGGEFNTLNNPLPAEGLIIEFPRFDPISLTRGEWIDLPDSRSKTDVLVSLRKKGYKPEYSMKARELFPEGYSVPLSEIEKRVFGTMIHVMTDEGEVNSWNKQILTEHLHGISAEEAIWILRDQADKRTFNSDFWFTRHEVGGYELNRLIAKEIEDRVEAEQKRDEIKMHALADMSITLERAGIPMLVQDHTELERLRYEFGERQDAKVEYWKNEEKRGISGFKTSLEFSVFLTINI